MLFSSFEFIIFFLAYYGIYKIIPARFSIALIIIGSLFFYGWWNPSLIFIPIILSLIAFVGTKWIENTNDLILKKIKFFIVIIITLLPLIFFKYINFIINDILSLILNFERYKFNIILPLGISFISFTAISYIIDVYKKRFPIEKNFFRILAYVLFFPQLIAGPILRPSELLPQLIKAPSKNSFLFFGITLFSLGLIKKIIFADGIANNIDPIFSNPIGLSLLEYWIAIIGFSVQIYCDFSGYTDMAIGLALILGLKLPINFNRPYLALNLKDFWQRWHITLSKWLKDYIYIPLGGNRSSKYKHIFNILITMTLGGIWHGANWNFLIWGLLHGILISLHHIFQYINFTKKISINTPIFLKRILTLFLIFFTWIFFRAEDFNSAIIIISGSFSSNLEIINFLKNYFYSIFLISLFFILHKFDSISYMRLMFKKINKLLLLGLIIFCWLILIFSLPGSSEKFIYFDF